MKNLTTLFLLLAVSITNASPTPDSIDLSERDSVDNSGTAEKNWFTVTEYASPSDACEGPHTAQNSKAYLDPAASSGCHDVAADTTRLLWETQGSGYLLTFSEPGCRGPSTSKITNLHDCFGKKNFYNTVASYEAWYEGR